MQLTLEHSAVDGMQFMSDDSIKHMAETMVTSAKHARAMRDQEACFRILKDIRELFSAFNAHRALRIHVHDAHANIARIYSECVFDEPISPPRRNTAQIYSRRIVAPPSPLAISSPVPVAPLSPPAISSPVPFSSPVVSPSPSPLSSPLSVSYSSCSCHSGYSSRKRRPVPDILWGSDDDGYQEDDCVLPTQVVPRSPFVDKTASKRARLQEECHEGDSSE